jgi:hypothetical protein
MGAYLVEKLLDSRFRPPFVLGGLGRDGGLVCELRVCLE